MDENWVTIWVIPGLLLVIAYLLFTIRDQLDTLQPRDLLLSVDAQREELCKLRRDIERLHDGLNENHRDGLSDIKSLLDSIDDNVMLIQRDSCATNIATDVSNIADTIAEMNRTLDERLP